MSKDGHYAVGRGRPPVETRFKPGASGNPAGRPRGARSVESVIKAAVSERVVITENGRRRSVTKLELAAKQLANKAAGGDARASKQVLDILQQYEAQDDARGASPSAVTTETRRQTEREILEALRNRHVNPKMEPKVGG